MARQFVRLKLRLIRNGMRAPQYAVFFILGTTIAGLLAFIGFGTLASVRNDPSSSDVTVVIFGAITMLWTVVPLLGFGTDETLDPQRLATLPLTRRQLVTGVFAASLVGVAPLATLVALSGALVGLTHSVVSFVLIAAAVVLSLLLCVVASRTIVAVMVEGRIAWAGPIDVLRAGGSLEDAFVALVGEPAEREGLSWLERSSD